MVVITPRRVRFLSPKQSQRKRARQYLVEQLDRADLRYGDDFYLASFLRRALDLNEKLGDPLNLYDRPERPNIREALDEDDEGEVTYERGRKQETQYWDERGDTFWERYGPDRTVED